jgi:thiamine-phosphate pyrophosphorylase
MFVGWPRFDLFVITDPDLARGRSHTEMARAALEGGADAVQLRDKSTSAYNLCLWAREIQPLFVVNDRVDVALIAGAEGAHIGPSDLPVREARKLLPKPAILGVSAGDKSLAKKAQRAGADYLGVGPVFPTTTKPDGRPALGIEGLAAIIKAVSIPVVAIGGINHENVSGVIAAGAAGAAVISAVATAEDMASAARALKRRIVEARRGPGGAAGE